MKAALRALVACAPAVATPASGREDGGSGRLASPATKRSWEFAPPAYPTRRGPFPQLTSGPVTIRGSWFNPGSNVQVLAGMFGATL